MKTELKKETIDKNNATMKDLMSNDKSLEMVLSIMQRILDNPSYQATFRYQLERMSFFGLTEYQTLLNDEAVKEGLVRATRIGVYQAIMAFNPDVILDITHGKVPSLVSSQVKAHFCLCVKHEMIVYISSISRKWFPGNTRYYQELFIKAKKSGLRRPIHSYEPEAIQQAIFQQYGRVIPLRSIQRTQSIIHPRVAVAEEPIEYDRANLLTKQQWKQYEELKETNPMDARILAYRNILA